MKGRRAGDVIGEAAGFGDSGGGGGEFVGEVGGGGDDLAGRA